MATEGAQSESQWDLGCILAQCSTLPASSSLKYWLAISLKLKISLKQAKPAEN